MVQHLLAFLLAAAIISLAITGLLQQAHVIAGAVR